MWLVLSLLLLVVPILEIWLLMQLTFVMPLNTIFFQCLVTLAAGVWFMRGENFSLWTLIESELRNQRLPAEEVLADFLLWGGGVLLIIPGLLTDAIGLLIFIPAVRQESIQWLRRRMLKTMGRSPLEY
ncbi:MAG: FxsA family protein [SAR324 cluster bacterium]|nr:FxsA family protein [SAR324 cluster bacterium]